MKKNKHKKALRIILIFIFALISLLVVYILLIKPDKVDGPKILDKIKGYSYNIKENDSKLKKDTFKKLEKILNAEEIDYNEYAKLLSQMFIIDVYTLDTKISKYDIGGLEYLYDSEKEKFKNLMADTLYDIVKNNADGKRDQELPVVSSVEVLKCEEGTFTIDNKELLSYDINLKWSYERDLGYDTTANLKLVKEENKVYIVSYNLV